MRPWALINYAVKRSVSRYFLLNERRLHSTKVSKPLRVLFCGSDEFSCESLRALDTERKRNPALIASIDVLCRPGKKSGRSMTKIREVPIKAVAQELGLSIYERDTFRGWDLPKPHNESINLIIAVSFGLFVPPRILKSAEHGGLNVHPSLLPNFRGPAPLQHTIMAGEKSTGVTLQTLDETSFDHGVILSQTPLPGLPIPSPETFTYNDLLEFIKPKAAEMLVQGLRDRLFVPPLIDVGHYESKALKHAPKITPQDRQIQWSHMDAETIYRCHRALQRLWSNVWVDENTEKRIIFEDLEPVLSVEDKAKAKINDNKDDADSQCIAYSDDQGVKRPLTFITDGNAVIITLNDQALRVRSITLEGQKPKAASKLLAAAEDVADITVAGSEAVIDDIEEMLTEFEDIDDLGEVKEEEGGGYGGYGGGEGDRRRLRGDCELRTVSRFSGTRAINEDEAEDVALRQRLPLSQTDSKQVVLSCALKVVGYAMISFYYLPREINPTYQPEVISSGHSLQC
ncbi:hypothetical protein G7Y89_g7074 [Cudoniella acicularis]|uniref:methionyl-tRNA formyltransferase n=1 Tax=Cudoniella acicularis TaxID=354080 RepID=A0A8H4RKT0_9HELO|nr:hypothetical protein G7Y89_g7074 [Cudoniella acicularis]